MTKVPQIARIAHEMKKQSGFQDISIYNVHKIRDDGTMIAYAYSKGDVLVTGFGCYNNSIVKVKVTCY